MPSNKGLLDTPPPAKSGAPVVRRRRVAAPCRGGGEQGGRNGAAWGTALGTPSRPAAVPGGMKAGRKQPSGAGSQTPGRGERPRFGDLRRALRASRPLGVPPRVHLLRAERPRHGARFACVLGCGAAARCRGDFGDSSPRGCAREPWWVSDRHQRTRFFCYRNESGREKRWRNAPSSQAPRRTL